MTEINLLPWRVFARKKQQRNFILWIVGIVLSSCFLLFVLHFIGEYWVRKAKNENVYWVNQLNQISHRSQFLRKLNLECERDQIALQLFKRVESNQIMLLDFFKQIFDIMPYEIILGEMKRHGQQIELLGSTTSANSLSQLLERLNKSKFINQVQIAKIKNEVENHQITFRISIKQKNILIFNEEQKKDAVFSV